MDEVFNFVMLCGGLIMAGHPGKPLKVTREDLIWISFK